MERSEPHNQVSNMNSELPKRESPNNNSKANLTKSSKTTTLMFEALPSVILESIFQYVQPSDLLKLMPLSRNLYSPAARIFYRSITVSDSVEFLGGTMCVPNWRINSGTFLPYHRLKSLVGTLETNKELGRMVRTVSLYKLSIPDGKLVIDFLALVPNLNAFHNTSSFVAPQEIVRKLSTLTCLLEHDCNPMDNIRELRIVDFDTSSFNTYGFGRYNDAYEQSSDGSSDDDDPRQHHETNLYRRLARNLVGSGGYVRLRKLHLSSGQEDISEQFFCCNYSKSWISFFDELNLMKVKLSLDSLAIHGVAIGKAQNVAEQIQGCVRLKNLEQLILVENFYKPRADALLLKFLTMHTPNLKSLAVFTSEYHDLHDSLDQSHVHCLSEVLQNQIPHQLTELALVMSTDNALDRHDIQRAILASQKNLVRLKIDDGRPLVLDSYGPHSNWYVSHMDSHSYGEKQRQLLFPRVIGQVHYLPYVENDTARQVLKQLRIVDHELSTDMIYKNARDNFPSLTQYILGGAYVDPKSRGIYVNGRIASLDGLEEDIDAYENEYEVKEPYLRLEYDIDGTSTLSLCYSYEWTERGG